MAPPPPSNEILLGRAKQHMRFKEWERAIVCLDDILREPKDHPVGTEFVPDKEVSEQKERRAMDGPIDMQPMKQPRRPGLAFSLQINASKQV